MLQPAEERLTVILVLDENLSGHSVIDRLRNAGIPVKAQTEIMQRGIPDEQVLAHIASHPGHYLISKDSDFHRHTGIRATLIRHNVGAFYLTGHKGKTGPELAEQIIKAWPKMQAFIKAHSTPFVAKIVNNSVEKTV